jgi:hypothetical protein
MNRLRVDRAPAGAHLPAMRATFLLLPLLLTTGAPRLQAQTEYYARVGAVGANDLLRDVIVDRITVRQSVAPMVAVGGSVPLGPRGFRAGAEATFASGGFHSSEAGARTDLGTVRTGTLLLDLEGPILRSLRWRVGLGGIKYFPKNDSGIFLEGGSLRLLAGAGLDFYHPVLPRWDLMTSLRYDFHRFTTDELDRRGFSQTQGVSRVSLSVGLSRAAR